MLACMRTRQSVFSRDIKPGRVKPGLAHPTSPRPIMASKSKLRNAATVSRNYLLALFDFSLTRYITIQMLPVVYGLMILACGVVIIDLVVDAFGVSSTKGWVYAVLAPFAFIVLLSIFRSLLEFFVVVFRIAEDMEELAGMRESVDKISGLTDISSLTRPIMRLLNPNRRRHEEDDHN
jgi:hypothetical protein